MISKRLAIVDRIKRDDEDIQEIIVILDDKEYKAYNYTSLTGRAKKGDQVVVNTTAVELSLGTGGYHFVILNLSSPESKYTDGGHIMKLRYTPFQIKVDSVEEQGSKYHDIFSNFKSLENIPVVVGALHSILSPFCSTFKRNTVDKKLVYIMSEGAALPIMLSNNVKELKKKGLIDYTITIGNAFGGDFECVNIYTALITAKEILKADCILVAMGPGIAGTGTKYGFSGIEQGNILDAAYKLGANTYIIPRISFGDKRERHRGISHHTITVLNDVANNPTNIIIDREMESSHYDKIKKQLESDISDIHKVIEFSYKNSKEDLDFFGLRVKSMGRTFEEDREFFEAASLVAKYIADDISKI